MQKFKTVSEFFSKIRHFVRVCPISKERNLPGPICWGQICQGSDLLGPNILHQGPDFLGPTLSQPKIIVGPICLEPPRELHNKTVIAQFLTALVFLSNFVLVMNILKMVDLSLAVLGPQIINGAYLPK